MIIPSSSSGRPDRSASVSITGQTTVRAAFARPDHLSTENAALLRAALVNQPEIRAEVVARARVLASDPGYPPLSVVRLMAQQILASPDLSEDES